MQSDLTNKTDDSDQCNMWTDTGPKEKWNVMNMNICEVREAMGRLKNAMNQNFALQDPNTSIAWRNDSTWIMSGISGTMWRRPIKHSKSAALYVHSECHSNISNQIPSPEDASSGEPSPSPVEQSLWTPPNGKTKEPDNMVLMHKLVTTWS